MAITNYSDLQETVADYIFRSDAPVKAFIARAENDVQPFLKHYLTEDEVTLESVGNVVTLPADFLEARRVLIDGMLAKRISVYGSQLRAGEIGYLQSGNGYSIAPPQDEPRAVTLTYYKRLTPLSDAEPTNWLITKFPNVYLAATLVRAYRWLKNPEEEAGEKQSLKEALAEVASDHARALNSGNPIELETRAW